MMGVVMAAGKGSRISKLTNNKPKSFLELKKKFTIIDYQIDILRKLKIKKILIIVGYKKNLFRKKFNNEKDIKLIFNKNWKYDNVLSSFSTALPNIKDSFIFLHADSLTDLEVYYKLKKNNEICLAYKKKKCGYEEMKIFKKLKKIYLSKKMINKEYLGEFMGIAHIPKKCIGKLKLGINILKKHKNFNNYYFEELINYISRETRFVLKILDIKNHNYQEIDFYSDYLKALKIFNK